MATPTNWQIRTATSGTSGPSGVSETSAGVYAEIRWSAVRTLAMRTSPGLSLPSFLQSTTLSCSELSMKTADSLLDSCWLETVRGLQDKLTSQSSLFWVSPGTFAEFQSLRWGSLKSCVWRTPSTCVWTCSQRTPCTAWYFSQNCAPKN